MRTLSGHWLLGGKRLTGDCLFNLGKGLQLQVSGSFVERTAVAGAGSVKDPGREWRMPSHKGSTALRVAVEPCGMSSRGG